MWTLTHFSTVSKKKITTEIRKYIEINENKKSYKNLHNAIKADA